MSEPLTIKDLERIEHAAHGIGLLAYDPAHDPDEPVSERLAPALRRLPAQFTIRRYLTEEQKHWAKAGNADGARWTPFAQTCRNLAAYVREHCGCTLKEALTELTHHYRSEATALSCLTKWLSRGVVKGIACTYGTRPRRLHVVPCRCAEQQEAAE